MGREIKRVALDFDYPINQMIWKGYFNPYSSLECKCCGGTGEAPEIKALGEDWYGFDRPSKRWCHSLEQDEVQNLFDEGRLSEFKECPSADHINNVWAKEFFGHDAINRWICVKFRAKKLGITELDCKACVGEGALWPDDKYKKLCEDFEWIDPPSGEGYQLWSTTTEGTPMSPVFDTPEKLAQWLFDNSASSFGRSTSSYETWLKFINGPGWAPSAIMTNGNLKSGVDASI